MKTIKHNEYGKTVAVNLVTETEINGIFFSLFSDEKRFYVQMSDGSDTIESILADTEKEALSYFEEWKNSILVEF